MKKKSIIGESILLILGVLFAGAGVFMLANRFIDQPLWSFNSKYITDAFFFVLLGVLGVFIGALLLFGALSKRKERRMLDTDAGLKQHMGMKASSRISNTVIYAVLVLVSIIWLVPFVCIVIQSFRVNPTGMMQKLIYNPDGEVHPEQMIRFGFDNYVRLFVNPETGESTLSSNGFLRWYLNTFIIALIVAAVQTIIVLCMSYTLSRFRFKMRKPLMQFMLILGMFPGMLAMIILYQVLKDIGLAGANAIPGLILVYCASSGMGYYVSKGFFDTIPKSLDEAARVDGATRSQVLFKIILPLAKPIVIYTVLTAFMGPWGDFVFAKYVTGVTPSAYNVAVGLQSWLATDTMTNNYYTMFCAGGVVVAIPVVILFMCLQRYYVEGVTGGAVKG